MNIHGYRHIDFVWFPAMARPQTPCSTASVEDSHLVRLQMSGRSRSTRAEIPSSCPTLSRLVISPTGIEVRGGRLGPKFVGLPDEATNFVTGRWLAAWGGSCT
jgi:hypothetical protein